MLYPELTDLLIREHEKRPPPVSWATTTQGFTFRTYTHATRQMQDQAADTADSFMARARAM